MKINLDQLKDQKFNNYLRNKLIEKYNRLPKFFDVEEYWKIKKSYENFSKIN